MADDADELIGRRFGKDGRLVVKARLNEGGIGTVYEAFDTKGDRKVAMKFLRPEYSDSESSIARFKREGQRFADLEHPNIVKVYGLGREHGLLYLALEFVEGRSLGQWMRKVGTIPSDQALRIGRDIASALQAAHEKSIVHRDLKPDNIMVREPDGQVMLLDFGIAKRLDSNTMLTKLGTYLGTPGYSAPEQVKGLPVDHRADIFPLGIILYEMLAGRLAFSGTSTREVLASTLKDRPLPVMKANDAVSKPIARLIERMIEKNPDRRCQSMAEVIQAIDGLTERGGDGSDAKGGGGLLGGLKRFLSP